jgi:hypothetical protein
VKTLDRITHSNDPAQPPRRRGLLTAIGVAVVLVVAALVAVLVWRGNDTGGPSTTPSASAPGVTTPATSPSPTLEPSPSPSVTGQGTAAAIPVYYVADVAGGPRLYREFHRMTVLPGGRIVTALTEMFAGRAADPDYASLWPADTTVRSVKVTGDLATVDVSRFVSLGSSFEGAAVQELVYTVTAADPAVSQVKLLVNGQTPPSGHMDWSAPVRRQAALDIQAFVWILAPTQGATVASPVKVTVLGTGFEGNVPLKVYRGTKVVASTFVTTMMGGFAQASTTISLPPGQYELRAYNDNGRDATLQLWDTKSFTVR